MEVLFFIDDLGPGGAQRQLVNLAIEFKNKNHTVTVLSYYKNEFYYPLLLQSGINLYCFSIGNPILRIIKIRRFIRKGKFEAVIAFLGVPSFIAEISSIPIRNWKLIVSERSANPRILKSFKSRFMRFFHVFADHIISNSFANQQMVRKVTPFISKSKFKVIYNSIDLKKFFPLEHYKFKENLKLNIIVPASYRKLKNLIGLIEAVNLLTLVEKKLLKISWYGDRLPNSYHGFILDQAEKLIQLYQLQQVFTLNDVSEEIHLLIQQADAVGIFSFFEGLPNVVCEGMASGKPIIATSVSDIPLIVTNNENGVLCNPQEIASIANALRNFISVSPENLEKMGIISRERAVRLFDKDMITEQYLRLLES